MKAKNQNNHPYSANEGIGVQKWHAMEAFFGLGLTLSPLPLNSVPGGAAPAPRPLCRPVAPITFLAETFLCGEVMPHCVSSRQQLHSISVSTAVKQNQ